MGKPMKKFFSCFLALCVLLTQVSFTSIVMADTQNTSQTTQAPSSTRLGGNDRYKTSVIVSQKGWNSSQYVVLVRGDDYPDALCAGPLAKKYGAPILLTPPDQLNQDTLNEIKRLGAAHVIIVGGSGAVSKTVEDAVNASGIKDIDRIAGKDRFETSVKVAERLGVVNEIALVTGQDFPDALSISPVAAIKLIPILLTENSTLPDCTKQYLADKKTVKTYVVGGTGAVNESVFNNLPNPKRISGPNRYETNLEVLKTFSNIFNYDKVYLSTADGTSGNEFADALSGSVLAACSSSPLLLLNQSLPESTKDYIKAKIKPGADIVALGGEAAVPVKAVDEVITAVKDQQQSNTPANTGNISNDTGSSEQVTIISAKFNGLTQIVANTSTDLSGITTNEITITKSDKSTVPAEKIKGIKVEPGKLTIDIDPDQFISVSSAGTKIATKTFRGIRDGLQVDVAQSSDPLDAAVWNKITTVPQNDPCNMWHNLSSLTAVRADLTPYDVKYNGQIISKEPVYKQNGTLKALMVVIDFPDAKAADNTGINGLPGGTSKDAGNAINGHPLKTAQDYYDYLMPRAKDFFANSSYGKLNFEASLVTNKDSANGVFTCNGLLYGKNSANNNTPYAFSRGGDVDSYLTDAFNISKPALSSYPGGPYDILYVVAVENAVGISYGPTNTVWPDAKVKTGRDDLKALVRIGYDSYSTWRFKAVNHETGHDLGLVDYYINGFSGPGGGQCDPNTGTTDYYPMVGHWNIMGYIDGTAPDYFAWDKWRLGWINDHQVDIITGKGTTTHQLTPLETPGGTKMIVIPGPSKGIAYVVENRQLAGVDNTALREVSTDPDPANQNTKWNHRYGTFSSPGILMYKINLNVPTLNGPLTVVDLYPERTDKELGTLLDSSVLGASSGIYSYTDPAAGVTIKLDKETDSVDTLTVINNPPETAVKPVLSDARFIDFNTIEFKTNMDLRGIYRNNLIVRKDNSLISDVYINQITPQTIRVTFTAGQITSAKDTSNVTVSTTAFSYFGASDAAPVAPLSTLTVPVLTEAKFNSLTEVQAKSDVDLSGIKAANVIIKMGDGSIVSSSKITNVSFDAVSKVLTATINTDQFTDAAKTVGTTISTSAFSNYNPAGTDLQMAKYNPPVKVFDSSAEAYVDPYGITLQGISITTPANRTIYAKGEELDISGMVVTGTYSNSTTHVIPVTAANVTGFNSSELNDNLTLTVTLGGHTATYNVAVKDITLDSIIITSPAAKTDYAVGEKLDLSGLAVKGIYTGGVEQVLSISPSNITGFDSSSVTNSRPLTITYLSKTATYNIKVAVVSSNAYYKFLNKGSSYVMEANDGGIDQWWDYTTQYDPTVAEWKFIDLRNGYYKITNKGYLGSGYLRVKDGSTADNAILEFSASQPADGSDLWAIEEVADGYYKITNKNSGKALGISDINSKYNSKLIAQSTYTASDNQLWKVSKLELLTLQSIAVTTPPVKTIYKTGEELDLSGIEVKGKYSDGSDQLIVIKPGDVSGFDSSKAIENQPLTITYGGKATTLNVTTKDAAQFVLQSIEITTPPVKTVYNIGESLNTSGMVVTGTYTGNIKQAVKINTDNISGFDSSKPAVGQVITVTYEGKTATFNVIIKDPVPVSIAVTTQPKKTIYLIGEQLDTTGLEVTGTYNDGSKAALAITAGNITGFDSKAAANTQTLTVTYGGRTTTFDISVKDPATYILDNIELTSSPAKTLYIAGESLDLSGMVVTGKYKDGSSQTIANDKVTIGTFDNTKASASQAITVTYQDKTASFTVSVFAPFVPVNDASYKITNKSNESLVLTTETASDSYDYLKVQSSGTATWTFKSITGKDGYYEIGQVGKTVRPYVDVWGGGTDDGNILGLWSDYSGNSQYWTLQSLGDSYYRIVNANSKKVIDIGNSNSAVQNTYKGSDSQFWKLEQIIK